MRKTKTEVWGGAESRAFYRAVCDRLTRATRREREQVCRELADHLQDHTEALIDRGLEPEAAEARAVAEMGDPAEIGKALNKAYSRFWLICKRVLIVLFCAALLQCIGRDLLRDFAGNMLARLPSQTDLTQMSRRGLWYADQVFELKESQLLNLKMESDSTVVRLEQIAVGEFTDGPDEKGYCVCFSARKYSKNPFDYCYPDFRLYLAGDPDGTQLKRSLSSEAVGGRSSGMCFAYEVEYGTEQVEIVWERYGQDLRVQVPLDWEGVS